MYEQKVIFEAKGIVWKVKIDLDDEMHHFLGETRLNIINQFGYV